MKQHFFLIVVSAFIVFMIAVPLATMFIDIPSFSTLIDTMSSDPNATKENTFVQSNS